MRSLLERWKLAGGFAAGIAGFTSYQALGNVVATTVDDPVNAQNPQVDIDFQQDDSSPVSINYDSTSGLTLQKQREFSEPSYVSSTNGIVEALPFGEEIGSTSPFQADSNPGELNNADQSTGQFIATIPPTTQYIGVSFYNDSTNQLNYGWIGFEVTNDSSLNSLSGVVTGYGYDDSGAAITAGEVPEPSSLALLAIGSAGVLAYRRKSRGLA